MRKYFFAAAAVAALACVAVTPQQAKASWLSEALHAYFDRGYYGANYGPAYGYYGPAYDPYAPAYGVAPWYGYSYGSTYAPAYYGAYRPYWYGGSYRPWYGGYYRGWP